MERGSAGIAYEVLAHGQKNHRTPRLEMLTLHPEQPVERGVLFHESQQVELCLSHHATGATSR